MKKALKSIIFLAIAVVIFFSVQEVMTPKWHFDPDQVATYMEGETDRYGYFYKLPKNTVDYFTIGASTSFYTVNPTRIYAETGITGYDLGSSGSGIELAYYMLREGLKIQQPKAVFIDMHMLTKDSKTRTDLMTKALIQLKPSLNKLEAALACQNEDRSAMELLFPLLQFHDRWKELNKSDFTFGIVPDYAQNGAYSNFYVNMSTDTLNRPIGNLYTLENGEITAIEERGEKINEESAVYFEKILALCQENGIELIPTHFATIWPSARDKLIEDYLEPFGLKLLNLTNPAVGLAWKQDTVDSGTHTNFWGNAKGSTYLADYLRARGFEDHRGQDGYELWDETLEVYLQWEQTELMDREIVDAYDYLNALVEVKDKYLIVLTVMDEASGAWNDTLEDAIHRLGVKSSFYNQVQNSFVAIIDQGENLFELWDERKIEVNTSFQTENGKKHTLYIASGGLVFGNNGSVIIDGAEQSPQTRGLNIVVIDKTSGAVISSAVIDSHTNALTLTQKTLTEKWKGIDKTYQLIEDGVYNIIPAVSDAYAIDVPYGTTDEDANIWIYERNGLQPQEFEIKFIGDGLYTIRAVCSDKYLSIEDMGSTAGSNVVQQTYTGLANQKWFVTENENGSYSFASLYNGCVLDVQNGRASQGTNIQVWTENFLTSQLFYLERVEG